MSWYDIVIALLLVAAAVQGWRQGVIIQVLGLAAVVAGIFLARAYSETIGAALGLQGSTAVVAGFAIIFVATVLVVALIGRLTRGLFRIVGLGVFDSIFGVVFSLLKVYVLVWLVLRFFHIESVFNNSLWMAR